ncbi:hypothetical protein NFJ02_13g13200 [Pycnococcus provasolii]
MLWLDNAAITTRREGDKAPRLDVRVYTTAISMCQRALKDVRKRNQTSLRKLSVPGSDDDNNNNGETAGTSTRSAEQWLEPARTLYRRCGWPNERTTSAYMRALALGGDWRGALREYEQFVADGAEPNAHVYGAALSACALGRDGDRARQILSEAAAHDECADVVTYSSAILACARAGMMEQAVSILDDMQDAGVQPNAFTYAALVEGYGVVRDAQKAMEAFELCSESRSAQLYSALFLALGTCGNGVSALRYLNELREDESVPTINAYNYCCVLRAFERNRPTPLWREALALLRSWDSEWTSVASRRPPLAAYNTALHACAGAGQLTAVETLIDEMRKVQVRPDSNTYDSLFRAYAASGAGLGDESFELFQRLMDTGKGYTPTPYTYAHLLNAFSADSDVRGARAVWTYMQESGVPPCVHSANAMIRVFMSAERYDDALRFYDRHFIGDVVDANKKKQAEGDDLTEVELQQILTMAEKDAEVDISMTRARLMPNDTTRSLVYMVCERGASDAARAQRILAVAAPIGYVAGGLLGRATGLW